MRDEELYRLCTCTKYDTNRSFRTILKVSVGDNFYDSGIDFTTGGIQRFQEAWVDMYSQGVFESTPWYQCLGNHDVVKGQSGVDFQTKVAPIYDSRWNFVCLRNIRAVGTSTDGIFLGNPGASVLDLRPDRQRLDRYFRRGGFGLFPKLVPEG